QRDRYIPIWCEQGRYRLDERHFLQPLKLSLSEAMALFLAARLVSRYSDERDPSIESAFHKLATILPRPVAQHVEETVRGMLSRHRNPQYTKVFEILAEAWSGGRRVKIWYPDSVDTDILNERLVEPYFLEPSPIGHACYLIGYCHHAGAMRTFKLERIRDVELTDQPYEIPADFDVNTYLRSSWGIVADEEVKVQLRFSPRVAFRVRECTWHPSQTIAERRDGGLDFTATVAGTMEITPWILSWGAEVEVVGPPELRSKIQEIVRRMSEAYS
ncbi:MAG: helix-turn-helix transcriptional regulator, partial [Chloroflexota bacterium]